MPGGQSTAVPQRATTRPSLPKRLRGFATRVGVRGVLKRLMRWAGFDLVKRHFYSPVPDLANLPDAFWSRRSRLGGVTLDADAQLGWIEGELAAHIAEFDPPRHQLPGQTGFYLDNGTYGPVDAELLYGLVRHGNPRRVVEIGSGFSSLVIGAALEANRRAGAQPSYEIVDPWPGSASYEMGGEAALRRIADLRKVSVTELPVDEFRALGANDILFVDATHTVKIGGDVNRIVLDILPALAPGVLVHFHDVFLPWEYPREWVERKEWYWAEQYLLQAFLAFNDSFEVLLAAHFLAREHNDRLARSIPSAPGSFPLALWARRTG
jgi:predicted O-methyltransferase YrrM